MPSAGGQGADHDDALAGRTARLRRVGRHRRAPAWRRHARHPRQRREPGGIGQRIRSRQPGQLGALGGEPQGLADPQRLAPPLQRHWGEPGQRQQADAEQGERDQRFEQQVAAVARTPAVSQARARRGAAVGAPWKGAGS
ncbi:hypothetical protein [Cupriavidus sp. H18C1]|uniref:hypothetical protein n=1 Tax=Cupriavidus sp. H18C1 TaxID=3241601 RepID=UPI003BB8E140